MEYRISKNYTAVAPSRVKDKKYDIYYNGKYLLSFGSRSYQQYHDKIGYYQYLDHHDEYRRLLYRIRHQSDHINDPNYSGYWSWNFLW